LPWTVSTGPARSDGIQVRGIRHGLDHYQHALELFRRPFDGTH